VNRLALSVPEAAELLGLSRSSVYAAVKRGDIPSVRVGGRVLVSMRALEQLINPVNENDAVVDAVSMNSV
jgi:excisionase family DNA binding protein